MAQTKYRTAYVVSPEKEVIAVVRVPRSVAVDAPSVSADTLLAWAQLIADAADKLAEEAPGAHSVQYTAPHNERYAARANNVGIKPRAVCSKCGKVYPLNKHGLLSLHGKAYGNSRGKHCPGSNKRPAALDG